MKFKNFDEFYNKSYALASKAKVMSFGSKQTVELARKIFNKADLNSYYEIGVLKSEQFKLLGAKSTTIKFSVDNLVKNLIKHSEITMEEYLKIPNILQKPDKICLSKTGSNSILLLKLDNKHYQIVIKTTINKQENYLTSFRLLSKEEFDKH